MIPIFQLFGFVGTFLVAIAYIPQIIHLAKEHCSAGVSIKAWLLWLIASIFIFLHAFDVFDVVFMTLQIINIVAILLIIILATIYKTGVCQTHLTVQELKAKS